MKRLLAALLCLSGVAIGSVAVDAKPLRWASQGDPQTADPHSQNESLTNLFSQAVLRHFPEGTRLSRPQGGFILWIELPPGVDTLRLHRDAWKHRINIAPGALFSVKDRYRNCLRLNCGLPWNEAIESAVRTLGELARAQVA